MNPGVRLSWSWRPAEGVRRHRRPSTRGRRVLTRARSVAVDLAIAAVFVFLWLVVLTRGDVLWL